MLEQLKASQGKQIVLELVNGRIVAGTILTVDEHLVRMETEEGVGSIPVSAVQIVWDSLKRSLTGEDMEQLAEQLKDKFQAQIACTGVEFTCRQSYICRPPDICTGAFSCPGSYVPAQGGSQCPVAFGCTGTQFYGIIGGPFAGQDPKAEIACTAFPGFSCAASYICRPPDTCSFSFSCPGSYVPSFPSGGGACPLFFCGSFQFGQPCGTFQFGQPCSFQFGGPCRLEFRPTCQPFLFACGSFAFGQPCTFAFGCGNFQFGQACVPFPFGSQCGTVGGFACTGRQFFGLVNEPGPKSQEAPLPPTDFAVKEQKKDKE